MGMVKNVGDKVVQHLDDLVTGNFANTALNGNMGINAFRALTSPIEVVSRYGYRRGANYGVTDALAETFLKDATKAAGAGYDWGLSNLNGWKMFGAYSGASLGASVLTGLTHDSAGNPDIAGLPLI